MGLSAVKIQARLVRLTNQHGTLIDVIKFTTNVADRYRQGEDSFAAPVPVQGVGFLDPPTETVEALAQGQTVAAKFVFSLEHLRDAFPLPPDVDLITENDKIGFEGKVYTIIKAMLTGRSFGVPLEVVVLAKDPE